MAAFGLLGTCLTVTVGPFSEQFWGWVFSQPTSTIIPTPTVTPILTSTIISTTVLVDGVEVDTTQPQHIDLGKSVEIMIKAVDETRNSIPSDRLSCIWVLGSTQKPTNKCSINYELPSGLDNEVVSVTITGKDQAVKGMADQSVIFTLR